MIRKFKATENDYRAYIELFCRTSLSFRLNARSENNEDGRDYTHVPEFDHYCRIVSSDIYHYIAYVDDTDMIIAGAQYTKVGGTACINMFYVMRVYQLRGIGRKFFHELQKSLADSGVLQINLYSISAGSTAFWKKMGFRDNLFYYTKYLFI